MIEQWLTALDLNSLSLGLLAGLLLAVVFYFVILRKNAGKALEGLHTEVDKLKQELDGRNKELADTSRDLAVNEARLEEQQKHFKKEKSALEDAEKRLTESFERLAGKVFDSRSEQFTKLSEKQLGGILKPLVKDLEQFRTTVDQSSKEDIRQHAQLQERLKQLEGLNQQLNQEAKNLTKALT
ncbi:MAG: DNA recombination protein RmuC, partial [Bacteroidia bacterium]